MSPNQLHRLAMEACDDADRARRAGDVLAHRQHIEAAECLEREALAVCLAEGATVEGPWEPTEYARLVLSSLKEIVAEIVKIRSNKCVRDTAYRKNCRFTDCRAKTHKVYLVGDVPVRLCRNHMGARSSDLKPNEAPDAGGSLRGTEV